MKHLIIPRLFLFLAVGLCWARDIAPRHISVGYNHVAALSYNNSLWMWGSNQQGQIYPDAVENYPYPVENDSWRFSFEKVSAGKNYTLALSKNRELYAIGANDKAQYGVIRTGSPYFTKIAGRYWRDIFAGNGRSFGISADSTLWGWGDNSSNLIGLGTASGIQEPIQIGSSKWISISQGEDFTIGIQANGTLWAWGNNTYGQIGDSTNDFRSEPKQILVGKKFRKAFAGGGFAGALADDSTLWMWGRCDYNQIPQHFQSTNIPVRVEGVWSDFALGSTFGLAVSPSGRLHWWGLFGVSLASFAVEVDNPPSQMPFKAVYAGQGVAFAVDSSGMIFSNGKNPSGEVGNGTFVTTNVFGYMNSSPIGFLPNLSMTVVLNQGEEKTIDIEDYISIALGNCVDSILLVHPPSKVLASIEGKEIRIKADRGVTGFDSISVEAVDRLGSVVSFNVPVWVKGSDPIGLKAGQVSTSLFHSAAILPDSSIWFWGMQTNGSFGGLNNDFSYVPVQGAPGKWIKVSTGYFINTGIRSDSTLWMWGSVDTSSFERVLSGKWIDVNCRVKSCLGILADSSLWKWGDWDSAYKSPVKISNEKWVRINTGENFGFAIRLDRTLWAMGMNPNGELGVGDKATHWELVNVGSDKWMDVSGEYYWVAGLKSDSTLWVWGARNWCAPENTKLESTVPVLLNNEKWRSIDLYLLGAVGIKADSTLWTFGYSISGSLGDQGEGCRIEPKKISSETWISASAGYSHMIALKSDSIVYTWGSNGDGELGNGSNLSHMAPQPVPRINQIPTFYGLPALNDTVLEDFSPISIAWSNLAKDDDGDSLRYTALSMSGKIKAIESGKSFVISPVSENWFGRDTLLFFAYDNKGGSAVQQRVLMVKPVNDAPVLQSVDTLWVEDCRSVPISQVKFKSTDVDGDAISLVAKDCIFFDGEYFNTQPICRRSLLVNVAATDGDLESESKKLVIYNPSFNIAPTLSAPKPVFIYEEDTLKISLAAFAAFDADGDSISFNFYLNPQELTWSFGKIIPKKDWNGVSEIKLIARDAASYSEAVIWKIGVLPKNDPPKLTVLPHPNIQMNGSFMPLSVFTDCYDVEGDSCWVEFLEGDHYKIENGRAYPEKDYVGVVTLNLVARDKADSSESISVNVQVVKTTMILERPSFELSREGEVKHFFDLLGRNRVD